MTYWAIKRRAMLPYLVFAVVVAVLESSVLSVFGADEAVLKPRVPIEQIEEARSRTNPVPATEETIEKGKKLFQGKPSVSLATGEMGKDWAATSSRAL